MNEKQRHVKEQHLAAAKRDTLAFIESGYPLNCAPTFWSLYRSRPGHIRRNALIALFERFPTSKLPVNNKWQANMRDPDLHYLMKKGVLVHVREGGCHRHAMNKLGRKRQSYLQLASAVEVVCAP